LDHFSPLKDAISLKLVFRKLAAKHFEQLYGRVFRTLYANQIYVRVLPEI
jgi:hypothetical protein